VGETGTVADPARQPGVREKRARQRHATDSGGRRRRCRKAAIAHRARGGHQSHPEGRTLRAAHGGRHRGRGRCGRLLLRRHRQPLAGPLGVPARPRDGRGPGVAVRPRLAAGPSVARRAAVIVAAGGRGPALRRHPLVPADAVRHIRLRNTGQLDGHALIRPTLHACCGDEISTPIVYNIFF